MLASEELDVRNAADPVGARVRRRSERPSEGRTERAVGMSAPLLDTVWSYRM